ncbi:2-C-methyl-D-erythritol 2,4-cyclodiphosphate synthase [Planctomonas sp. JC2975]|uniref:2-C-methyl-D-erythritol 4-phosphate cytidylyltransferase n=1 Tax=Planctomonas sp. JC2975 TaxID=2729626 RepID=UPI001472D174|nr:2-C-methyl-D-erythritol 4-phosphate cytidylyltransferase [Planctomonas sp. JC2975]NNC11673.1 2-C-methyl-D-erythritol 2,4-cyclodiphosphate synthase [Planctomonas sp. JC2975]
MSASSPRVAVIVVAAGSGTRLGAAVPKAFVTAGGRTLLEHAVHAVNGMRQAVQLIAVVPADRLDDSQSLLDSVSPGARAVTGGVTRQASVAAGLASLEDAIDVVLVHDAARAFTPSSLFDEVVASVDVSGEGAVPGLPVSDTVKRTDADSRITATVDRSELVAVQTPQGFPRDRLVAAYAAATEDVTDDAALVAAIGHPVRIVAGDPLAFKVTTPADLARAEQLLGAADAGPSVPRIGLGTDTHAFGGDGDLWLAGLHWPEERGLAGHSDGDAVAHAIVDALLSAAGLGDIGSVFGTDDPRFADARGEVFLTATRERLAGAGIRIGNVSVQLIGNRPRFSPRRAEAEGVLSGILGAPVSISATTTDGLGFTGRGEGVTAIATALVVVR